MTANLTRFGAEELLRCRDGIRRALEGAATMEGAARAVCRFLYEELAGEPPDAGRACALVRCYRTHPFGTLPPDVQRFAKRVYGTVAFSPPLPAMKCLTLLATAGDEPEWNDRRASRGHQAIPLPTPQVVERAPMIARMIREFGLDLARAIQPSMDRAARDRAAATAPPPLPPGVFHVEEALGSPYIPAQDFVARHGVSSVVGFGGALPGGDLVAVILFARVHVPFDAADRFRALSPEIVEALGWYGEGEVWE